MNEIKTEKRAAELVPEKELLVRADFMALRSPEWKIKSAELDVARLGSHYGLRSESVMGSV